LLYINDLPDTVRNLVKIFADDTKLFAVANDDDNCASIQTDLNSLSVWSDTWQLRFNAAKCKRMHIGQNNQHYQYFMQENGMATTITEVTEEKDLGVTFSNDFKFSKHIVSAVKKANRVLGVVKRTFTYIDRDMFLQLYKTLIRPHIEYGSVIWSPYLKKDIYLIENLQRRATKIVKDIRSLPYEDRLKILGLPTLQYRRERCDVVQVYKIVNEIDALDYNTFFTKTAYGTTRGQSHCQKLQKTTCRLRSRQNIFSQRVINNWNALSEDCVTSNSLNAFKSALNKEWKDKPGKFSYK